VAVEAIAEATIQVLLSHGQSVSVGAEFDTGCCCVAIAGESLRNFAITGNEMKLNGANTEGP
jgi:hypothetical protein